MSEKIVSGNRVEWGAAITNSAPLIVIEKDTKIPSVPPAPADGSVSDAPRGADLEGRVEHGIILRERPMSTMRKIVLVILTIFTFSIAYHMYWDRLEADFNKALLNQDLKAIQEALDKGLKVGDYLCSNRLGKGAYCRRAFKKACQERDFREFLISQPLLKEELKWVVSHIHDEIDWNQEFKDYWCGWSFRIKDDDTLSGLFLLFKRLIDLGELRPGDLSEKSKYFWQIIPLCFGNDEYVQHLVDKQVIDFQGLDIRANMYYEMAEWFRVPFERNARGNVVRMREFEQKVAKEFEEDRGFSLERKVERALRYQKRLAVGQGESGSSF